MGASESTARRLTINDEDRSGSIDISESVLERLKSEMAGNKSEKSIVTTPPSPLPPPSPPSVSPPSSNQKTIVHYVEEPTLSSLKVRADKEHELKELETHYQNRLNAIQDEHTKMMNLSEENFAQSVEKVKTLFNPGMGSSICQECRKDVMLCYEQNLTTPLLCSDKVKAFQACVNNVRLKSG